MGQSEGGGVWFRSVSWRATLLAESIILLSTQYVWGGRRRSVRERLVLRGVIG